MRIKRKLLPILCCIFLISSSYAELSAENGKQGITQQSTRKITGSVRDADGPMIGVTVSIPNSTTGTITDLEGRFRLDIPEGANVQFSMVGYSTQVIASGNKTIIDVVMKENIQELDVVVVVGAVMRKSDLTGAVGQVDSKTLLERPVTNINEALQGRVSGVFINPTSKPSDDSSIKIRGTNTINSGSDPIYVVDGLVMENNQGGFNSVNLNDVESVQVLKDASATALYGSRGANGVIVITTKKGKNGEGKVTYDGWVGISQFAQRPKTLNATQLAELRRDSYATGYMFSNPNGNVNNYIENVLMGTNLAFSDSEFDTWRSGESFDWFKEFTQTGVQQNHSLSFSGGSDKGTTYLSFNYANTDGLVKGTSQEKFNGRINAEYNIKPWLKVGTNTSYQRLEDIMPSDDVFDKALGANPLLNYAPYKDPNTRYEKEYLNLYFRANSEEFNNTYNPYNSQSIDKRRVRDRITSSNFININILNKVDVRTTLAIDNAHQSWFEFTPTGIQESYRGINGDARAKHERWTDMNWQWDNSVSYNDTFNSIHRVSALFATSASRMTKNFTKAQGERFINNNLGYYDLGSAADKNNTQLGSDFKASSLLSYLVRLNYSYKDKYLLTGTARYDGSSKFGSGQQWGIFPSFSLAWNVTQEDFMKDQKIFDQMKFRVGYGVVGNQDIPAYAFQTLYHGTITIDDSGNYVSGIAQTDNRRGTFDLTWEKQKQANLGIDISVLKSRLNLTVDAFYIKNDDLLLERSLASSSGFLKTWQNIGSVHNKGIELTVSADVIRGKDFNWSVGGNISMDKNNVKTLFDDAQQIWKIEDGSIQREGNLFLNQSLNGIYTYVSGGIAQEWNRSEWEGVNYNGKDVNVGDLFVKDVSGPDGVPDGIVDSYDKVVVGKKDPKFYGGFSTDLSYKGLSLSTVFTYSYGAKKTSGYYEGLVNSVGTSMASTDMLDRWTPTNTETSIPRAITNVSKGYNRYNASETSEFIQDASYLRMSTLTLSYNLPRKWLTSIHVDNLKLYFTGSNLFCITPYKGFDPEMGDWGYPPSKMYVFGVNLSF